LNPNYEVLEQLLRLDSEAGNATVHWRSAQRELVELAKKTAANEELIGKTRTDMSYLEGEQRRVFKRIDELEERKAERSAKLFSAKNDEEHRTYKREVDHIDRDLRDSQRRTEDNDAQMERLKNTFFNAEEALASALAATSDERLRAEKAQLESNSKLGEIDELRTSYIDRLEDRLSQHYRRVAKITRNPAGPITRVVTKACGNCHMGLSPQLINTILRGEEVHFCPSCNHILLPPQNS
jgi:predicted  nucleic acid-binding Zn-ribbon protein